MALFAALLSVALSACAGNLDPEVVGATGSGGTGASAAACDAPTLVLVPKCAQVGCHAARDPASGLDLASAGVAARLLGKTSDPTVSLACAANTIPFLTPQSNPATGLFLNKLDPPVSCGLPMPEIGTLSSSDTSCLQAWATAVTTGVIAQ